MRVLMLVVVAMAAAAFHSVPVEVRFFARPEQQHGNYRGIEVERWSVARLETIGRFFRGYRQSPAESLATDAIGAIGWYSEMKIFDYFGLVDPHIAHLPVAAGREKDLAGHQKTDFSHVVAKRPTYLMFSRLLTPTEQDAWASVPPTVRPAVEAEYEPRAVWLDDARNGESGFFTFYQRKGAGRILSDRGTAGGASLPRSPGEAR